MHLHTALCIHGPSQWHFACNLTGASQTYVTYLLEMPTRSLLAFGYNTQTGFLSTEASVKRSYSKMSDVKVQNCDKLWQMIITLTFMLNHWPSASRETCLLQHYCRSRRLAHLSLNSPETLNSSQCIHSTASVGFYSRPIYTYLSSPTSWAS